MFARFMDVLNEKGIREAARYAHALGHKGVELFFPCHDGAAIPASDERKKYKAALVGEGLNVSCVSCYANLVSESCHDKADKGTLSALFECVDLAADVGSPYLHHTLYCNMNDELEYDAILSFIIEGARSVADYARGRGITVLFEPQGFYFNGIEGFGKFYSQLKELCTNVGVCLDVGNPLWVDEEPYEFTKRYINDIKHVHLKDYVITPFDQDSRHHTRGGKAIVECEIGAGVIDIARILRMLDDADYSGYLSFEDNSEGDLDARTARTITLINNTAGKLKHDIYGCNHK